MKKSSVEKGRERSSRNRETNISRGRGEMKWCWLLEKGEKSSFLVGKAEVRLGKEEKK